MHGHMPVWLTNVTILLQHVCKCYTLLSSMFHVETGMHMVRNCIVYSF